MILALLYSLLTLKELRLGKVKQLVQVCLANKGNRSELGLNWGHKHMNSCQSCCAPHDFERPGACPACLSLTLRSTIPAKEPGVGFLRCLLGLLLKHLPFLLSNSEKTFKKKKNPRAGNILFPTKRIFCSQLCGRKYFSCGLGMGWIPSLLGQCLRT